MIKISVPIYVITAKSGKGKKYWLNLNNYPKWHYRTYNAIKDNFRELMSEKLAGLKLKTPIKISFTLYRATNHKGDRANILAVVEKFFCDSLEYYGCIPDDSDRYIKETHYYGGTVDKDNPRVDIEIGCE